MQPNKSNGYLIIRHGGRWSDVLRLHPTQRIAIGRASQSHVVVADHLCSRFHAELYWDQEGWWIQDQKSRNGTFVNGIKVEQPVRLRPGDQIQVGSCSILFSSQLGGAIETAGSRAEGDGGVQEPGAGLEILHQSHTAALLSPLVAEGRSGPGLVAASQSRAVDEDDVAAELFRLAFDLAGIGSEAEAAQATLSLLRKLTGASAGAVLIVRRGVDPLHPATHDLVALATEEDAGRVYRRVDDGLVEQIFRDGQAVLARNPAAMPESQDSFSAVRSVSSLLAIPFRDGDRWLGLVHLYCGCDRPMFGKEDLEVALAASQTLGLALVNLRNQDRLLHRLRDSQRKIQRLQKEIPPSPEWIAVSPAMDRLMVQLQRLAQTRSVVLIRGESGVGKEVVARELHRRSPHAKGPFVAVNCAALAPTLLESELFGHEKGAFTGASERSIGRFELAEGGTIFLDEIGELPLELQAKLLRVLDGHPFERVGGSKSIQSNARVLAATNRDLEEAVREKDFREDLYFRLRVIELMIPPLRERTEDILPLAEYFLERFLQQSGQGPRGFSPEAVAAMTQHRWPGNVRELKNAVERAWVLCVDDRIAPADLALDLRTPGAPSPALSNLSEPTVIADSISGELVPLEEIERRYILRVLEATHGNKSRASAILGIERSTLDRKLKRFPPGGDAPSAVDHSL
jgi:Nif-specific regulatory protein